MRSAHRPRPASTHVGRVAALAAALVTIVASVGGAAAATPATATAASATPAATTPAPASAARKAPTAAVRAPVSRRRQPARPDLGPNVLVFDPSMATADIQATVDRVTAQQVSNQFGTQRYALLFEPGTYGTAAQPLIINVGYSTEVAGLGLSPMDVTINGQVDVYNQCFPTLTGAPIDCTALDNFWRSLSNLSIHVAGGGTGTDCRANTEFWAVSQAAPMRRVQVLGNTTLQDYCTAGPQYASGGFIADSAFAGGTVINGGQQQFYTRNTDLDGWTNGVWNQVFSGDVGAPAQSFGNPGATAGTLANPYTTLAATPASREKPFLYVDRKGVWRVLVPAARTASVGTDWQKGYQPGRSIALEDFFIARPSDPVATINKALAHGRDLLITPGVYGVAKSIAVKRADTVVLGLGIATLTAQKGAVAMTVADVRGVDIAGLTFDAGPVNSPALLRIGTKQGLYSKGRNAPRASDPTAVQDVFFRIGGPHVGKASVSLEVNSDHTIVDDIWAWRADHGTGVGWTVNTAATGVVVNGDHVTATGLFVEHYQRYDTVWNGEHGKTVFYQNEMPYDAPDQAAWRHGRVNGFAAYKVAASVRTHEAWGLGSYIFTNVDPTLHATNAFEVPVRRGVRMHDLVTISLNGAGTIDHVVNGVGDPVTPTHPGPSDVVSYP